MKKEKESFIKKGWCLLFALTALVLVVAALIPLFTGVTALQISTTQKVSMLFEATKNNGPLLLGETWSVPLNIQESLNGKKDSVVFGEAPDASDGKDGYDTPKPGPSPSPYLYAYFTTTLPEPYDILLKDYRLYPGTNEKTWTLTIICFFTGTTTDITISWDKTKVDDSEYGYVELYYGETKVANMLSDSQYILYGVSSNIPYYFSVKGRINQAPVVNAGDDATTDEGSTFAQGGSFTDAGSYSWTGTVNYGDGSGTNALILNSDKTFSLSHVYADNGVYTATVKVKDDLNVEGTNTVTVTVSNVAPTATLGNDGPKDEGSLVTVSFSAQYDPGTSDTFTYSFDWDNDGSYDITDQTAASASHTWYDEGTGTYTVKAKIKDNDGGFTEYTTDVTVNNANPTASLGNNGPKYEGSEVTVSFSGQTDPGTSDTFTYSFDWDNDGTYDDVDQVSASGTHTWYDEGTGTYTVKAKIKDNDGGFTEYTTDVTVSNVAPTVDTGSDKTINQGDTFTSSGSFTDPGTDIWTATVNYGDGSGTNPLTLNLDKTFSLSHPYTTGGTFTVTVTVNDGDSGIGTDTAIVTVLQLHILTVKQYWNLISIPCYDTIAKTNIKVRYLGTDYNWSDAVSAGYILDYLYGWSGSVYIIETSLTHGMGYWFYAYEDCQLLIYSNAIGTGHIVDLLVKWNIIGLPYTSSINTVDLHFEYLSSTHTWQQAIDDGYILGFVYGWDRTNQMYSLETQLQPGYGYWMYAYTACTMKQ
jgi:hypothetical protein